MTQIAQHKLSQRHGHAVYAEAYGFRPALDVHKSIKNRDMVMSSTQQKIQVISSLGDDRFQSLSFGDWLPACAAAYHISPNVEDYVLVPVIAMPSDLPNRNGVAFPLAELKRWSVDEGCLAFETFRGKPVHIEHDNQDETKAIGVIVDVAMKPMNGFGAGRVWKMIELLAIDRTKNPTRASQILTGEHNAYSMGAWVESYSCGYCRAPMGNCNHLHPNRPKDFYVLNGALVHRRVGGIKGFETSSVGDPAFVSAISDRLLSM